MPSLPDIARLGQQFGATPEQTTVFDVEYLHLRLEDGTDLYVTEWGLPFLLQLLPQNHWADKEWFSRNHETLPGTSSLYRLRTKEVRGVSKEIVLKWNRMGQDIPGETEASDLMTAEFNSPFEEFGLVTELRNCADGSPRPLFTHKPLAIMVPRTYVEKERLGRRSWRFERLQRNHKEVTLDPNRNYAVIYEWIKGIDAGEAMQRDFITQDAGAKLLEDSNGQLAQRGYSVKDNKPHHLIVRPCAGGGVAEDRAGNILYALVDFELLERTPEHERDVRTSRRRAYLSRQPHRFEARRRFPPALSQVSIMGVDYVYGRVESSAGALWVVGDDPVLFDYFLPEKWRKTPRSSLSDGKRVYETTTKDDIHLVWRISRVGQRPTEEAPDEARRHGYNSPFEEVSLALELNRRGIETTYPRAIYMSRHRPDAREQPADMSRYETHEHLVTPDGHVILSPDHGYIVLWGYWNGPDELLAVHDEDYYRPIDTRRACEEGLVAEETCSDLLRNEKQRLQGVGVQAPGLKADHLLLSVDRTGRIVKGADGLPMARLCSYDLLIPDGAAGHHGVGQP